MRVLSSLVAAILLSACFAGPRPESEFIAAVRGGDAAAVRAFARQGADLNAPEGGNGWTPLLHAIHKRQIGSVAALLDTGADVNRAGPDGMTPLMMAAGYGYTDIVTLLLHRGARADLTNHGGETALDWALTGMTDIDRFTWFTCQDETVRALLAGGAPHRATPSARRWARMKGCQSAALLR